MNNEKITLYLPDSKNCKIKKYRIKNDKIIVYLENRKKYEILNTPENEKKIINEIDKNNKNKLEKIGLEEMIKKESIRSLKQSFINAAVIFFNGYCWINCFPNSELVNLISFGAMEVMVGAALGSTINYINQKNKVDELKKNELYYKNEEIIKEKVNEENLSELNNKTEKIIKESINEENMLGITSTTIKKMKYKDLKNMLERISFYNSYDFEDYKDQLKPYENNEIEELSKKYDSDNIESNQKVMKKMH